jgi:hypothetical protein
MSRPDARTPEMPARGSRSHERLCGRLLAYTEGKALIAELTLEEPTVRKESTRRLYVSTGGNVWKSPCFVADLVRTVRTELHSAAATEIVEVGT